MTLDRDEGHDPQSAVPDKSFFGAMARLAPERDLKRAPESQGRRLTISRATKLRLAMLAQQVGYIQIEPFSHRYVLDKMPKKSFGPNEVIPCTDLLYVIERGSVQLKHARNEYLLKELSTGGVFGHMPVIGQTMMLTRAVAGRSGVTLTVMNSDQALQWVEAEPLWLLKVIGPRLFERETDLFRVQFCPPESRVAALLLNLCGDGTVIEPVTHTALGESIGMHREIVTSVMRTFRKQGVLQTGRRKIVLLDKEALKQMSKL